MAPPLQPPLRPSPPWLGRAIGLALLVLAVLVVGWLQQARHTPPRLLSSDPGADNAVAVLEQRITSANQRVWVKVYVMRRSDRGDGPVERLVQALAAARQRGVDVRVVLDRSRLWGGTGEDPKHLEAMHWLQQLGLPVLIDGMDRRTHSKAVLIDDRWVVVGSHNWTHSAMALNRELSILLEDPRVADQLAMRFLAIPGFAQLPGQGPAQVSPE